MANEITGKLVQTLPVQTGTSARGEWKKQQIILEVGDEFPRNVCITLWRDRVNDIAAFSIGDILTVGITVESREWQEQWFTDVTAWRVQKYQPGTSAPSILEVTGRLVKLLPLQEGTSTRGEWKIQDFVIEAGLEYPRKICLSLRDDRINDIAGFAPGDTLTASVRIESRENSDSGRWFTNVRAVRILAGNGTPVNPAAPSIATAPATSAQPVSQPIIPSVPEGEEFEIEDDLPF
jgi:hypothetical protein